MKRLVLFMFSLCFYSLSFSQCLNTILYDGEPIPNGVDINNGEIHEIAYGIAAGEYVVISGLNSTDNYEFTSIRTDLNNPNTDYITVYNNASVALGYKASPLTISSIGSSTIEIHINLDSSCNTDDEFHTLTIQNLTAATCNMPGAPGGITYKSNTRIDFYWSPPNLSTPTGYDWQIVPQGNQPNVDIAVSGSTIASVTNASSGNVLTPGNSYWIYVRSTCVSNQYSDWFKFPSNYIMNTVAPPENDYCEGATSIIQDINTENVGAATSIVGTLEGGAGTNKDAETCSSRKGNARDDVWYTFIAQTSNIHINLEPTFDGVLTLYSGDCSALNYLACADTPSVALSNEEIITGSLNIGQRYYIRVYYFGTSTPLNPTFNLKLWSDTAVTDNDNDGYANHPSLDCNDDNETINPSATEICDGLDNDCDGLTDEGLTTVNYYPDLDGDGFGDTSASPIAACSAMQPANTVANNEDCDDTDANVNPNAIEILDNLKDDDCNPSTADSSLDTDDDGDGYTENDGDCDDTKNTVNPDATDIPDNGIDEDCDGSDIKTWYLDADDDGYGNESQTSLANTQPTGYVSNSSDCDDNDSTINPDAVDVVGNGVDENCDGVYLWYQDSDNDGYGSAVVIQSTNSTPKVGEADNASDCSDSNSSINPEATDVVANGIDENCDGQYLWYQDKDNDGYGTSIVIQSGNNNPGAGESYNASDCNDDNAAINPTATEICDNIDNDCDALIDDDDSSVDTSSQTAWFEDLDGDSYGNPNNSLFACSQPAGYVANDSDCNDTNADINPEAEEIPNNDIDDNCDGQTDETLAIIDLDLKKLSIKPNPFNTDISIQIPQGITQVLDVSIFDIRGRLILKTTTHYNSIIEINHLDNLPQGLYLLKLSMQTANSNLTVIRRLVKL